MTDHPLVPSDVDTTVHFVLNDYGTLGCAYVETDLKHCDFETIIDDMIAGQYSRPVRVTAVNVAEGWARDVSGDVAREVWNRSVGRTLREPVVRFLKRHIGFPIPV